MDKNRINTLERSIQAKIDLIANETDIGCGVKPTEKWYNHQRRLLKQMQNRLRKMKRAK